MTSSLRTSGSLRIWNRRLRAGSSGPQRRACVIRHLGAAPRVRTGLLGAALLTALLAACAGPASPAPAPPSPTERVSGQATPDITGVVALQDGGPVLTQASDGSYEGMHLSTAGPAVVSATGTATLDDLADGDAVEVWLTEPSACAGSAPVRCDILTIRVGG